MAPHLSLFFHTFRGLDMTPYILGEAANQITPDTAPIYDLYATVNHYGNVYLGHYTASIKSPVGDSKGVLMFSVLFVQLN